MRDLHRRILLVLALLAAAAAPTTAMAGGILLYEVGSADVGLASAGWGARAQDASTVLTNPAGMAHDSGFQDSSDVSPMLPADAAWRFGAGVRNQSSDRFGWGVAAEYAYGGTLGVDRQGTTPVLGGRGNLSGAYADTGIFFLAVHGDWRL